MLIGDHTDRIPCKINETIIEEVELFQYLGRVIKNNNDDTKAVEKCISKAWHAYTNNCKTSMKSKKKTYESFILPCLLYATETITWRNDLIRKMEVFQNNIMRICTNTRKIERTSIKTLHDQTHLRPIKSIIIERKLKWFGHIKRSSLPVRSITEGLVPGKRKRGRPRRRWINDILEWTKLSLNELNSFTRSRNEWSGLVKRVANIYNVL